MPPSSLSEYPLVQEPKRILVSNDSIPSFSGASEACKKDYEIKITATRNEAKNSLAQLKGSLMVQEWESSEQMNELLSITQAEKEFMKKYETIVQTLCDVYNIPQNRLLSLIGRETDFIDHFQNKGPKRASFGFCQLTKSVFADMMSNTKATPGGRGDQFVWLLNKTLQNNAVCDVIASGTSGDACRVVLNALRGICVNGKITDKQKYNQCIESLYKLAQKDQHVNLFISTLFQDFHASNIARSNNEPTCETSPKNVTQWRKVLWNCASMQDNILQSLVTHGDRSSNISAQDIQRYREQLIDLFKTDQNTYQTFLTLSAYNGNNKPEKGGSIPHKIYYAMSIMISQMMRAS